MKTRVIMVVAMISIALMPAFSNCGISSHKNSDGKTVNIYMPNPITHKTSVYHNLPLAESEAIYKLVNESSDHRKNYFLVDQYVRKNILNIEISQIETDFGRVIKQGTLYVINPGDSLESIWIKAYTYDYYMNNKRIIQT